MHEGANRKGCCHAEKGNPLVSGHVHRNTMMYSHGFVPQINEFKVKFPGASDKVRHVPVHSVEHLVRV